MARTSEEKHTTVGGIAGILYQFYVFLYNLLTIKPGDVVSFEKLDDTAKETPNYIALYQAKYTVKYGVDGEAVSLTNRAQDFWKAIDVWMDLIKKDGDNERKRGEQLDYINAHEFHFVSNKAPYDNDFYKLCQKVNKEKNLTAIDGVLDSITAEGRKTKIKESTSPKYRSVQNIIDDLKTFDLREEFISRIKFDIESFESIEANCQSHLTDTVRFNEEEAKMVFEDFKTEVEKDLKDTVGKGKSLVYTFDFQKKRFQKVFQFHRAEDLNFKIEKVNFRPEFLDLICIKQLIKVNDVVPENTDRIAQKTSHFLSFKNRYEQLHDNYKISAPEEVMFVEEVMTTWDDKFTNVYSDTNDDTPEDVIITKAGKLLSSIRDKELSLCKQLLGRPISNGAFYYFSDECKIGWHRDWKRFFSKQEEITDGQDC